MLICPNTFVKAAHKITELSSQVYTFEKFCRKHLAEKLGQTEQEWWVRNIRNHQSHFCPLHEQTVEETLTRQVLRN